MHIKEQKVQPFRAPNLLNQKMLSHDPGNYQDNEIRVNDFLSARI